MLYVAFILTVKRLGFTGESNWYHAVLAERERDVDMTKQGRQTGGAVSQTGCGSSESN